jgi:hypothetical protein
MLFPLVTGLDADLNRLGRSYSHAQREMFEDSFGGAYLMTLSISDCITSNYIFDE